MVIEELKIQYNYVLNRYYNGCNYVEVNPNEFDKYIEKIMNFKTELEEILTEIEKQYRFTKDEILGGFEIC